MCEWRNCLCECLQTAPLFDNYQHTHSGIQPADAIKLSPETSAVIYRVINGPWEWQENCEHKLCQEHKMQTLFTMFEENMHVKRLPLTTCLSRWHDLGPAAAFVTIWPPCTSQILTDLRLHSPPVTTVCMAILITSLHTYATTTQPADAIKLSPKPSAIVHRVINGPRWRQEYCKHKLCQEQKTQTFRHVYQPASAGHMPVTWSPPRVTLQSHDRSCARDRNGARIRLFNADLSSGIANWVQINNIRITCEQHWPSLYMIDSDSGVPPIQRKDIIETSAVLN